MMRFLALPLALAITGLTAPANAATVRHLDYAVTVYPTRLASGPDRNPSGPGTARIAIDLLGVAGDGGELVSATETEWNALRSRQTAQCEVYARGDVVCGSDQFLSASERVILPLLAHDITNSVSFIVSAPVPSDAGAECARRATYTVTDSSTDLHITRSIAVVGAIEDESVSYDRSRALPVFVHDETHPLNAMQSISIDAKLVGL